MIIVIMILALILFVTAIVVSMHYVVTSKKPEDKKIKYIKSVNEILEKCKLESGSESVNEKINKIIDELRYSDVNSPQATLEIEGRLSGKAWELYDSIKNKKNTEIDGISDEVLKLVKERNIVIKSK